MTIEATNEKVSTAAPDHAGADAGQSTAELPRHAIEAAQRAVGSARRSMAASGTPDTRPAATENPGHAVDPDQFLLAYLQTHDAVCPWCRYNLRAIAVLRCPECGRAVRLEIGLVEPFFLPWALTLTFMAMSAGVGIIFAGLASFYGPHIFRTLWKFKDIPLLAGAAYGMAAIPLTLLLLATRRGFFRLPPKLQWACAAGAFGINLAVVVYAWLTH